MICRWSYTLLWLTCVVAILPILKGEAVANRLDKRTQSNGGEYIPITFFNAIRLAEDSKQSLQNQLRNFRENLQKNLTTSTMLSILDDNYQNTEHQIIKLHDLSAFFDTAADIARIFAHDSEMFYEVAKNSSYTLLLQLRQMPTTQLTLVKLLLTNYFEEMEFFHIMFSEIIDEALEYTQNTLLAIQKTFTYYADVQQFVLQNWNFKSDIGCCKGYMEFLQLYSAQIFKCAAGHDLTVALDVFAMTEITSKYIMRQLEFRIQRLCNCFLFGNYEIRCKFLKNAERDFELLFSKLEELETYFDLKMKKGLVSSRRFRRRSQVENRDFESNRVHNHCIPVDFPQGQMNKSLKQCFYTIKIY
ncbi:uncharacterized protein LOC116806047 [Drosophila grimshawi]|uniref:uncharacterized protein LOC116806047 n=1 Tax=Drosophila grimshawi TaxID=7222 RepID=UPI000C86FB87|nr:uncharacterized protein LOC116806047 [Drosophila grimshawi]